MVLVSKSKVNDDAGERNWWSVNWVRQCGSLLHETTEKYSEILKIFRNTQKYSEILKNIQKYSKIFRNTQKYSEILKNIQKYSKIFNRSVGPDNGSLLHRTNETPIIKCTPSSSHVRIVHHKKRGRILPEKWCSSIFYVKISLCSLPKLEYYNFAIFKRKNLSDIYIFFSLTLILWEKSNVRDSQKRRRKNREIKGDD